MCFVVINQLVLWDPPVNYYSRSRWQGSTYNPRHSVSRHRLSGTLSLSLSPWKVPLPSPLSRHIWKLNCSLLHTTRSNISSAAGTSDSNFRHTTPPINVLTLTLTLLRAAYSGYYIGHVSGLSLRRSLSYSGPCKSYYGWDMSSWATASFDKWIR